MANTFVQNILSDDLSRNVLPTTSQATVQTMTHRIGMWGERMFGSPFLLGTAYTSIYTRFQRNVLSIFAVAPYRRIQTMYHPLSRWGMAMFGSDDILGAGRAILLDFYGSGLYAPGYRPLNVKQV